jgi:two-component system LytT family sensor kinase
MLSLNQPVLINILGHAGGALIFAIFLCLLFSGRGWSGAHGRYLSGLAAILSLAWNVGSLVVLAWPGLPPATLGLVVALSFSVLSLLPAVLLHLSLADRHPVLTTCGYILSAVAIGMHFREIYGNGAALHQVALLLITAGFLALTAAALVLAAVRPDARPRPTGTRIAASMCLALFAMSFVHFGTGHAHQAWSSELVIHHAGIPLALFVLLQDYRFVLLDAFVRFLANALLAAVFTGLAIAAALRFGLVERNFREPLPEALLLIGMCLFLISFAWIRNQVQWWLTNAVFQQGSLARLAQQVKDAPAMASEQAYLDWSGAAMAAAVRTPNYAVVRQDEWETAASVGAPVIAAILPAIAAGKIWDWAEAAVPIRLGQSGNRLVLLGRRQGGQRYLNDDLVSLANAAAEIAGRVESFERQEMSRLVGQAELRALQSQMNPHFLFNALNALYGSIPREADVARRMVLNLADIFRYFLQSDKTFVPLSEELQIVRAYLEVEQCRLASRLKVEIQVDEAALPLGIPVLSIQPIVENAIKHGIAPRTEAGYVRLQIRCENDELRISVENSSSGTVTTSGTGVGLENVRRRLEICYGPAATLSFAPEDGHTTVTLRIPLGKGAMRTAVAAL